MTIGELIKEVESWYDVDDDTAFYFDEDGAQRDSRICGCPFGPAVEYSFAENAVMFTLCHMATVTQEEYLSWLEDLRNGLLVPCVNSGSEIYIGAEGQETELVLSKVNKDGSFETKRKGRTV